MNGDREIHWEDDALTRKVIECIIRVHQTLGPGFLEGIYRNALLVELRIHGLTADTERRVKVRYKDVVVGLHRSDIVVEGRLVIEVKAVLELTQTHYAQTRSTLKAAAFRTALLVNFSKPMADFRRIEI